MVKTTCDSSVQWNTSWSTAGANRVHHCQGTEHILSSARNPLQSLWSSFWVYLPVLHRIALFSLYLFCDLCLVLPKNIERGVLHKILLTVNSPSAVNSLIYKSFFSLSTHFWDFLPISGLNFSSVLIFQLWPDFELFFGLKLPQQCCASDNLTQVESIQSSSTV